jgi:TM2 domain-containing membrane protein YozV
MLYIIRTLCRMFGKSLFGIARFVILLCFSGKIRMLKLNGNVIKAISFDITGTLITHRDKIEDIYAKLAIKMKLPNPPTAEELQPAFRISYEDTMKKYPCYRNDPVE